MPAVPHQSRYHQGCGYLPGTPQGTWGPSCSCLSCAKVLRLADRLDVSGGPQLYVPAPSVATTMPGKLFNKIPCFLSRCPSDRVPVGSLLFAAQRLLLRSNSLELELLIGFWGCHLSPILGVFDR